MAKSNYQIPFDSDGNLATYVSWNELTWRDNYVFEAKLRVKDYVHGRSAVGFKVVDDYHREYYITLHTLFPYIKSGALRDGCIEGRWTFAKRGANYMLVPA